VRVCMCGCCACVWVCDMCVCNVYVCVGQGGHKQGYVLQHSSSADLLHKVNICLHTLQMLSLSLSANYAISFGGESNTVSKIMKQVLSLSPSLSPSLSLFVPSVSLCPFLSLS